MNNGCINWDNLFLLGKALNSALPLSLWVGYIGMECAPISARDSARHNLKLVVRQYQVEIVVWVSYFIVFPCFVVSCFHIMTACWLGLHNVFIVHMKLLFQTCVWGYRPFSQISNTSDMIGGVRDLHSAQPIKELEKWFITSKPGISSVYFISIYCKYII